jgi:predicted RNase H-like HicB family nuclease
MAYREMEMDEVQRRFEELLQAVEAGCEIVVSQGGKPLAQFIMPPVEHVMEFLRDADPFYAVVIEKDEHGYTAWVPDIPDCVAAGDTEEEVEDLVREVMGQHLDEMRKNGAPLPEAATRAVYLQPPRAAPASA